MILLLDIGNTHTHLGLADARGVRKQANIKTALWVTDNADAPLRRFVGKAKIDGVSLCSVVPAVTGKAVALARKHFAVTALELTPRTVSGVGINYPQPNRIGPDRLANAVALRHHFGAPSVAVAFGTALAFDVVDAQGDYVGGIIAPGLAAMTDYLHDKTALLPRITIRETSSVIGKSTREAMLIGAVHGYRGLVRELILELKRELACRRLPVVATGGYAELIAAKLPEITAVEPNLTLEGLRLVWLANNLATRPASRTIRRA
ncbi:MAG: type III pantothenate kinase [Verrucomicrobia bacterium]|nr:type III pantothenate kinase [Verrucomicrobiota bacterium]